TFRATADGAAADAAGADQARVLRVGESVTVVVESVAYLGGGSHVADAHERAVQTNLLSGLARPGRRVARIRRARRDGARRIVVDDAVAVVVDAVTRLGRATTRDARVVAHAGGDAAAHLEADARQVAAGSRVRHASLRARALRGIGKAAST